MFEQNGNGGYVLKPNVFWDKEHPQYSRFNPSVIEREGTCFELAITVNSIMKNKNVLICTKSLLFRLFRVNI